MWKYSELKKYDDNDVAKFYKHGEIAVKKKLMDQETFEQKVKSFRKKQYEKFGTMPPKPGELVVDPKKQKVLNLKKTRKKNLKRKIKTNHQQNMKMIHMMLEKRRRKRKQKRRNMILKKNQLIGNSIYQITQKQIL